MKSSVLLRCGIVRGESTNASVSILRLPQEITVEIFKYTQLEIRTEYPGLSFFEGTRPDTWSWLTVTHVCKCWRNLGISTKNLWTAIEPARHACTEHTTLYLERSGALPLSVHYNARNGCENLAYRCFQLVIAQLHRIKLLDIFFLPRMSDELRRALFETPAPMMQIFSFGTLTMKEFDAGVLFANQAPLLTGLDWSAYSPRNSWQKVSLVRNLKHLRIESEVTVQDILSMFLENPNFERIWIISLSDITEDIPDASSSRLPVVLPYLKDLCIGGSNGCYNQISELFRNATFPNIITWDIDCSKYPIRQELEGDVYISSDIIPCISDESADCEVLELTICSEYAKINADGDEDNNGIFEDSVSRQRMLKYEWADNDIAAEDENITLDQSLSFICSVLQDGFWCSAKELKVDIEVENTKKGRASDNPDVSTWMELLILLPKLRKLTVRRGVRYLCSYDTLHFDKDEHQGLMRALTATHTESDGIEHLICPELTELCLDGMDLRTGRKRLMYTLAFRASRDKRVNLLFLRGPVEATDVNVRLLEKYVAKVEAVDLWDSDSDSSSDSESDTGGSRKRKLAYYEDGYY